MSENGADPETAGPWAVPSTWVWTEMGAIADVAGGGTPSTKDTANYDGGEIAWITPADLSGYTQKYIQRGSRNITSKGLRGSSARLLPSGTVLFSSRAPIGYVAIASRPVSTNQGFKNFVLNSGVQPDYAYYYLKRAKDLITQLGAGTTFKEVSGAKAARVPCPLPPLPEQHRIVAEIEKHLTRLDASVAALQRARANLKRYRAAVLKAACEGRLVPTEAELARAEGREFEPADVLLNRILRERRARWEVDEHDTPDMRALPELPEGWTWVTVGQLLAERLANGRSVRDSGGASLSSGSLPYATAGWTQPNERRVRGPKIRRERTSSPKATSLCREEMAPCRWSAAGGSYSTILAMWPTPTP